MPWPELMPGWRGLPAVALLMFCLAALCFPFSVAATNVGLALMLAAGLFSGLWWQGVVSFCHHYRLLFMALFVYLLLVPLGLMWSIDPHWGGRILGRHWFWLTLPVMLVLLTDTKARRLLLATLSLGLTLNLVYCVLQMVGIVDLGGVVAGSTAGNATGRIGHTSFGFIYGIWAAWLLHLGMQKNGWLRSSCWLLAMWALFMVFMAQGKSGYLVAFVAIALVAAKWLRETGNRRVLFGLLALFLLLSLFMATGPGQERLVGTWQGLTNSTPEKMDLEQQIAVSSATARLDWWKMSIAIWKQTPLLGVGTGGFPNAFVDWQLAHSTNADKSVLHLVHPHNQYLLVMVRWGVLGLIFLVALLYFWIRSGFSRSWRLALVQPLVALSGAALLVHGLSSASLEEHFSTIFALVVTAAGLSESMAERA
ncbi:O-antigen ligase family protein [Mariprofundus erugo]|uniref:O-antigen ligase family protein n=1 Tax=Mariprofundus erugo TaxID=2528639 RepID=UPI0010FD1E06|nr:O-antigen ligase family protein [Mariprofundus erugo]TLS76029.1 O-antigen ligase family protein [Mariprofundus erugo]